jgi:hypothetical protein
VSNVAFDGVHDFVDVPSKYHLAFVFMGLRHFPMTEPRLEIAKLYQLGFQIGRFGRAPGCTFDTKVQLSRRLRLWPNRSWPDV